MTAGKDSGPVVWRACPLGNAAAAIGSAIALLLAAPLAAPLGAQPVQSLGVPAPLPAPLPEPRDIAYPGTMKLFVDATDIQRRIFRARQVIPVAAGGRFTLLFPEWLPGMHSARGPVDDLAGLVFTVNGQPVPWMRDPVKTYAFHLDLPDDARELIAEFQYVSPTSGNQGRIVMTPDMLNLQWNQMALYPAGYYVRQIPVEASVKLPEGWRYGVSLRPAAGTPADATTVTFQPVSFETLVDSPMFAGRHYRREALAPNVTFHIFGDTPEELAATPEQIAKHAEMVVQAKKLFGVEHFDHYDLLLAITDVMGGIGLEHHRSSENGVRTGYFTKWNEQAIRRNLIPHEYAHSWVSKYRRPADLYTADFSVPMRNSLLWIYEGQDQYWGYVLQARSGLVSREDTLAAFAMQAALHDTRPGKQWRPLADTTNDPILSGRRPQPWISWQRAEDYYNEGMLIWLDADMLIREKTGGRKSLDDFARAFFGGTDGDWGVKTYTLDDVVATLDAIAPHDWRTFLDARVREIQPRAPLDWLRRGGYRLVYAEEPTAFWASSEKYRKVTDLSYSLGIVIDKDNGLDQVIWDGPAFKAGLTVGARLLAVNGLEFDTDRLKKAIKAKAPFDLLVKEGDRYRTVRFDYAGGLRYPRLEKTTTGEAWLDRLLAPRR